LLTGLLAGNEFATLIAVHPALRRIPLSSQIEAEQALTRRLGAIMPVAMSATLIAAIAATVGLVGEAEVGFALAAAVALGVMLAITLIWNVPLNRRTVEFFPAGDERSWSAIRRPWERLHLLRVVLDLLAFACLVAALAARLSLIAGSRSGRTRTSGVGWRISPPWWQCAAGADLRHALLHRWGDLVDEHSEAWRRRHAPEHEGGEAVVYRQVG